MTLVTASEAVRAQVWKSGAQAGSRIVQCERVVSGDLDWNLLEQSITEGENPVRWSGVRRVRRMFCESSCLGLQL